MNEAELKSIWQSYDTKIDKILAINKQQLFELQSQKADLKIRSFRRNHVWVMVLGILWVAFLAFLVFHSLDKVYFAGSLIVLIAFNVFAVLLYLSHIVILSQISISDSIAATQEKLARVYKSYTNSGRILLLQTPFYCTWWYSSELIQNGDFLFWTIQFVVVTSFTSLAVFLFIKLSPNNPSEKWRKISDKYFGAEKLRKAMDFLKEVEE